MDGLPAFVASLRPVDRTDLARAAADYARDRRLPRFFLDPAYLCGHGPTTYLSGRIDGVWLLVKRRMIHATPILQLLIPPVDPAGDRTRERDLLLEWTAAGGSAVLSPDDLRLLDLPTPAETMPPEIVYRAGDYADLTGPRWKRTRNYLARLPRSESTIVVPTHPQATALAALWSGQRARGREVPRVVDAFYDGRWPPDTLSYRPDGTVVPPQTALGISWRDSLIALTLSEQIGPGWAAIVVRSRDYEHDGGLDSPTDVLHVEEARRWPPETLLTIGAAARGGAGMVAHKHRLGPYEEIPLYQLRPTTPLSRDLWGRSKPGGR